MPSYLEGGEQAFGALSDQERKTAAYNALSHAYGPAIAYDPANALAASRAEVSQQTIPTQVAQEGANLESTQASTAGKQLENKETSLNQNQMAAYRAADLLSSQANPDGSIPQDAYDKIVRPNAALFGIDPAHVDGFGTLLSQPGGAQYLQHVKQSMLGPTPVSGAPVVAQGANGNSEIVRFDKFGRPITTDLGPGVTPVAQQRANIGQENAATAAKKVPIAQQNADTNAYRAGTTANNSLFGNPNGPAPGRASAPAATKTAAAPAASQSVIPPDSLFAKLPPKGRQQAISGATQIVNQGTNLQSTNQILDAVDKQISPYTAGAGSLLKDLPGTEQKNLKANLDTLQAQGLTSWIQSLKNSQGQTGIGRVLQSEAKAAMTLFGNMEQDQSAKQLAFHAQLFRRTVNNLYQHAQDGFKAQYGVDPHSAIGEPAGGGPSGPVTKTYNFDPKTGTIQ